MANSPSFSEDRISQIPALQLLTNLGFEYIPPEDVFTLRGKRLSNVVLDEVLATQLRKINRVNHKGREYPFTEGNILEAVEALKNVPFDGLVPTNEKLYDLICLGKSLPQTLDGDTKSFSLKYIDWDNPENNAYHCTAEYSVERTGRTETRRPDIVLFVNGIPLVVIECKSPKKKDAIDLAVRQNIRNQLHDEIPGLYVFSQLVLALATDQAKYGTTNTVEKFWAEWKEELRDAERQELNNLCNTPLTPDQKRRLFSEPFQDDKAYFDSLEKSGAREVTCQDELLSSICRPTRLLELVYRYIIFDLGVKKVARYQQYFCVKKIMERVKGGSNSRSKQGGVVWHTQGSGKSLTMVMLAKALALDETIENPRIILVTDRVDLDDQIWKTFHSCGKRPVQATTGTHLVELLIENKEQIITTVIHKFESATSKGKITIEDPNIFVLVDEGHRTQYSELNAKMSNTLPNACFIAFTGTPVARGRKNTITRFGGLIDTYTIAQATDDKAVVELLYEGRHVPQDVHAKDLDSWFEAHTKGLTEEQKADLKRKFSTADQLNMAEQKIQRIAYDISLHFSETWKGTGFKGQLVAQRKEAALLYKKYLDECGLVTSEVLISGPNDYEVDEDDSEASKEKVEHFWKKVMNRFGTEREYNKQLINAFKGPDDPEIIIVVDKLLTGFDAPRNAILYLTRKMKDHQLLQAIARVNRLFEGKDFGYIIDYRGVLEELDEAMGLYGSLEEFEAADLRGVYRNVSDEVQKLSGYHAAVWDIFKEVPNKQDYEAFQQCLADEALRFKFYERFTDFARSLGIALSTNKFHEDTPEKVILRYKSDLKFFKDLRYAVRRRYAEIVSYTEYEKKIKKLIDVHVGAGEVETITQEVNIFDEQAFAKEVEKLVEPSAKADTIAHKTLRTITDRMDEDPAFYLKFSKLIQDAIDEFRNKRISANEYLSKVKDLSHSVVNRTDEDIPDLLKNKEVARSIYGLLRESTSEKINPGTDIIGVLSEAAIRIEDILENRRIVNWSNDLDRKNLMRREIDDQLFDFMDKHSIKIPNKELDELIEHFLRIFELKRA